MSLLDFFRAKKKAAKPNAGKTFDARAWTSPSPQDAEMVARGRQKTAVVAIDCGGCGKEWKDAVVPNQLTHVTCPHCGGTNCITVNLTVYFV